MIKINKSPNVPATLQNVPVPTCAVDVLETVYKADDVRTQLVNDQHHKCCYCECDITKAFNDVEHYRPKSHYYWLGYDWNNLLYSCDLCNRTYKNDKFPLAADSIQVTKPTDNLANEKPLIINPTLEEPSDHIKFRRYEAVPLTTKGEETIVLFDLNNKRGGRAELVNCRKQLFEQYKEEMKQIKLANHLLSLDNLDQTAKETATQIRNSCNRSIALLLSPSTPYSGMLIAQI